MKKAMKDLDDVVKVVQKLKPILQFTQWEFHIHIMDEDHDGIEAEIMPNNDYLEAIVRFYPLFFRQERGHQVQTIIHELCHIFTEPQYILNNKVLNGTHVSQSHFESARELETTKIERVISSLIKDINL